MQSIAVPLQDGDVLWNQIKIRAGVCKKKSKFHHHCPVSWSIESSPSTQIYARDESPSGILSQNGKLTWSPEFIDYGKGLFRTYGAPEGRSCGDGCWRPVPQELVCDRCFGALPASPAKMLVLFQFAGAWESKQWITATMKPVAVKVAGENGEIFECTSVPIL